MNDQPNSPPAVNLGPSVKIPGTAQAAMLFFAAGDEYVALAAKLNADPVALAELAAGVDLFEERARKRRELFDRFMAAALGRTDV
jgi:hypothetical protein